MNRLLEKGYSPEDIILEKEFPAGHGTTKYLDILVKKEGKSFLMIECKTWGKEYEKELKNMHFVAGSMFYARTHAIEPLIKLQIPSTMFEEESGQHDGTMAHAIERVFTLSAYHVGMIVADTSFPKNTEGVQVTDDHPYTW